MELDSFLDSFEDSFQSCFGFCGMCFVMQFFSSFNSTSSALAAYFSRFFLLLFWSISERVFRLLMVSAWLWLAIFVWSSSFFLWWINNKLVRCLRAAARATLIFPSHIHTQHPYGKSFKWWLETLVYRQHDLQRREIHCNPLQLGVSFSSFSSFLMSFELLIRSAWFLDSRRARTWWELSKILISDFNYRSCCFLHIFGCQSTELSREKIEAQLK